MFINKIYSLYMLIRKKGGLILWIYREVFRYGQLIALLFFLLPSRIPVEQR